MRGYSAPTVFLSGLLITGAFACPSALPATGAERALRVATFQCDVTPRLGAAIYSSYRPLETIEHPLLAKGIVLDGGGQRYVLCSMDWCEVCNGTHVRFREKMAEAAGTDASRIAVQTIHQHTAPMGDGDAFQIRERIENAPPHLTPSFFDEIADRLAAAVKDAIGVIVMGAFRWAVTVTNPDGQASDFSRHGAFTDGSWDVDLPVELNALPGTYWAEVTDLAAGQKQGVEWTVM